MEKKDFFGINEHFGSKSVFTIDDLRDYFLLHEPNINDNTIRWRIHYLKANNIIKTLKRGAYTFIDKPLFEPPVTRRMLQIDDHLTGDYSPELGYVYWSTEWLHQFMVQQPTNIIVIVETEKDWLNSVFNDLQNYYKNIFFNPTDDVIRNYISIQKEAIIVKPLISRAPITEVKQHMKVATLEKMLVDVFCDQSLFTTYQGIELQHIFINAWKQYSINVSTLMNYAKRRKRAKPLQEFIKQYGPQELYNVIKL